MEILKPGILMKSSFSKLYTGSLHIRITNPLKQFLLIPQLNTLVKKTINLTTMKKNSYNSDTNDGSVEICSRQPILYSFASDKPPGYSVFCDPEAIHYQKIKNLLRTL